MKIPKKLLFALTFMMILVCSYAAYSFAADNDVKPTEESNPLIETRDQAIIDSFEIDLSDYTEINPPEEEYFNEGLLSARRQIDLAKGDTVPVTYINSSKNHAYLFKQDSEGMNHVYEFSRNGDEWTLLSSDSTQGVIMEEGRKNRESDKSDSGEKPIE